MDWHELYPQDRQPTMAQISDYIGEAKERWLSTISYIERAYQTKPKLFYSACGMKPGWNVKYQKSGQSFGTLYPEKDSFSVFIVISYKLEPSMEYVLPSLSGETAELYRQAGDYMKLGKWMMFRIGSDLLLEDYKKILTVKLPPKIAGKLGDE